MIAGREAAPHVRGEAKNPATTGTAAWGHEGYVRHVLGLQRKIAGLVLDPRLPDDLIDTSEPVTIGYTFREARHNITIKNPDGVNIGVKSIKVDGQEIEGQLLPLFEEGSEHDIEVTMGQAA
jgi:cellobiose phosphorylase